MNTKVNEQQHNIISISYQTREIDPLNGATAALLSRTIAVGFNPFTGEWQCVGVKTVFRRKFDTFDGWKVTIQAELNDALQNTWLVNAGIVGEKEQDTWDGEDRGAVPLATVG